MNTLINRLNLPITADEIELTDAQARRFPHFIAARDAANEANNVLEAERKALGLPRFEDKKTIALYAFVGKGRKRRRVCIGEIQCSPRAGYPVPPGWVNKVVDKLTPETRKELDSARNILTGV